MSESARPAQSQITTPNLHVEATDGVTYRYRRFGTPNASNLPLVCLVHFRASLDNWDPKLVHAGGTAAGGVRGPGDLSGGVHER